MGFLVASHSAFADNPWGVAIAGINNTTEAQNVANYTIVNKYHPALLLRSGNYVRLMLQGATIAGRTVTISAVYIGHVATSGNAYNFDGTQVQVTFGGLASISIPSGTFAFSDIMPFTLTTARALLIAFNAPNTVWSTARVGLTANYVRYHKPGILEAATTLKGTTGYIASAGVSSYLRRLNSSA